MNSKNIKTITVETIVRADIDSVWDCWTKPEHIINWNFASDEWCCPKAENDLKTNGEFSWRMEAKDGSMGFDFSGTYETIIDKELITYKMEDGRFVKIAFSENQNQTTISETFDAEGTHADEQQRAGWQAILENFKNYVETKK
ncbi:SRPBCC family protein [Tamlana sp. 2_MG-2023]|uniref:SRPBCC family protein n=1 Tax=unclassified Tamlana TaxID=2614803 RepID=UPI0026E44F38|nr:MULTISPECIES: SRPBCC family protein [unclassified Tamlana]MDO6761426.1 SRPBCC family protein [Tamlana sp. 2_MG-2023]MDO6792130.1 SRPBCC family protein [Tamlana sp. 1_MG-2023]